MATKTCRKCKEQKELTDFYLRTTGYRAVCKNCYNSWRRSIYVKNPNPKRGYWGKGRKMSDEFCRRISLRKLGRKMSPESNKKMVETWRKKGTSTARGSWRYKKWREDILKRDNFCCTSCGCNDRYLLHVHHIKSYNENRELRIDLNNGTTLCNSCHGKQDGFPKGHIPWAKGRKFTLEHVMKSVNAKKLRRELYANN